MEVAMEKGARNYLGQVFAAGRTQITAGGMQVSRGGMQLTVGGMRVGP